MILTTCMNLQKTTTVRVFTGTTLSYMENIFHVAICKCTCLCSSRAERYLCISFTDSNHMQKGQSVQLSVSVETENYAPKTVNWKSDTDGVTVDINGHVTVATSVTAKQRKSQQHLLMTTQSQANALLLLRSKFLDCVSSEKLDTQSLFQVR